MPAEARTFPCRRSAERIRSGFAAMFFLEFTQTGDSLPPPGPLLAFLCVPGRAAGTAIRRRSCRDQHSRLRGIHRWPHNRPQPSLSQSRPYSSIRQKAEAQSLANPQSALWLRLTMILYRTGLSLARSTYISISHRWRR